MPASAYITIRRRIDGDCGFRTSADLAARSDELLRLERRAEVVGATAALVQVEAGALDFAIDGVSPDCLGGTLTWLSRNGFGDGTATLRDSGFIPAQEWDAAETAADGTGYAIDGRPD
jgi:hypothetical protein